MLITKINPVGIDWYIQQLQNRLHTELISRWGLSLTPELYECYGRCYRNKKNEGYIAEIFKGGKAYEDAYWDDKLAAISFFGISSQIKRTVQSEADVHLVFFANLTKLKPWLLHRGDEEVRKDVAEIIGKVQNGFTMTGTELWIENVLREYAGSIRDKRMAAVDMQPIHCFRINLKLIFDQTKIC